jgi:hypothetical protein
MEKAASSPIAPSDVALGMDNTSEPSSPTELKARKGSDEDMNWKVPTSLMLEMDDTTETSSPIQSKPRKGRNEDMIWSPVRNSYVKKSKIALLEIELVSRRDRMHEFTIFLSHAATLSN